MLARVADNLYWFSRYLRRAENMARLVNVCSQLQLDLPRAGRIQWRPLVDAMGAAAVFDALHTGPEAEAGEAGIVRFLLVAADNPFSLQAAVHQAREILRTIRETLPQDCWLAINDLYLYMQANAERVTIRRYRQDVLDRVVDSCLRVSALLGANASRDIGYQFLRLGTAIEQADMTTRCIDAAASGLIQFRSPDEGEALQVLPWMSVLQSLAGYQMYRRHMRQRVTVEAVLRFLLQNGEFPRSVLFCLRRVESVLPAMPPRVAVGQALQLVLETLTGADTPALAEATPCAFLDELQIGLAGLHDSIQESYLRPG